MRSFVFWTAVLAITAGSFTAARADEKKDDDAPAPAAAATAEEQKKEGTEPAKAAETPAKEEKKAAAPEKTEPAKQPAKQDARQLNPANPWSKKVNAQAAALAKSLSEEQSIKVAEMMMGFEMVRQIRTVEKDVNKAVEECGKKNPDMKDKVSARFEKWKKSVDPAVAQNEKAMNAAIKSKVAGDPGKIRDYFDLVEKYGEYEEVILDKHAASSAEDCERLVSSMDRTQIALTEVLQKIKWPEATEAAAPAPEKTP